MIYGFSSEADNRKNADMAELAGVTLMRSYDLSTIDTSTASLNGDVLYCAQQGVKLILLYNEETVANGGRGPDMALGNLVSHIASVGPNGTLWNGANEQYRHLAPTHIEVGNEFSYSYRGDQVTPAIGIANTVQRFYNAVGTGTAHGMKFICEGEDAGSGSDQFMNKLLQTVPTIRTMLDGWTVHGYGPLSNEAGHAGSPGTQYGNITRLDARLVAKGFTGDKIWITENGISTDNGVSLTNNYGWAVNKTYSQAATNILAHVRLLGNGLSFSSRIYCYLQFQGFDQFASGTNNDRERYFGVRQNNGSAKGTFTTAAATLASEFPAPTGGGGGGPSGIPMPTANLSGWTLIFNDDFTTDLASWGTCTDFAGGQDCPSLPAIYRSKWWAYPTSYQDTRQKDNGDGGFYHPDNMSMSNSCLQLKLRRVGGVSQACAPIPKLPGGPQTYGRYAVCFSCETSATFKIAWLLWREVATWGEIDFPEGDLDSTIEAFNHHAAGQAGFSTTTAVASGWHVCVTEWIPGNVSFFLDGVKIGEDTGGNVPSTAMSWVLQSETKLGGTLTANPPDANILIDWVAVWSSGAVVPPTAETPGRGGAVADARAPAPRAPSPRGDSISQGVGTSSAVYTSLVTYPSLTVYPSPFVGLKPRTAIVAGGAISGGRAPGVPGGQLSQSPTPGGAIAGGFQAATTGVYPGAITYPGASTFPGLGALTAGVTARSLVPRAGAVAGGTEPQTAPVPGGATAGGNAPGAREALTAGGAVAAGTAPADRTLVIPGGAIAGGVVVAARSAVTAGGAIAAGATPGERIAVAPVPGGAVASGAPAAPRAPVTAGAFIADGFSAPVGPAPRASVLQGGAVAGGNAPSQGEPAVAGGAVAAGAVPTARADVPAGAATADGYAFSIPPPPPITTIGGADAAGMEPTPHSALIAGGATASGTVPASQTTATPTPGGADAGANAPSAGVTPPTAAGAADGPAPAPSTSISAGGALAAGNPPGSGESAAVPTPGGASADGTAPSPWITVEIDGAIGATNQITGATVLITPGGALTGAHLPVVPPNVSHHFDDDDGPVLAGAFDSGTQRGQT